jgi:hypothetical protein
VLVVIILFFGYKNRIVTEEKMLEDSSLGTQYKEYLLVKKKKKKKNKSKRTKVNIIYIFLNEEKMV